MVRPGNRTTAASAPAGASRTIYIPLMNDCLPRARSAIATTHSRGSAQLEWLTARAESVVAAMRTVQYSTVALRVEWVPSSRGNRAPDLCLCQHVGCC